MSEAGVRIEDLGLDLCNAVADCLSVLMALDPPANTPEGTLLAGLADAVEKYEQAKLGKDFAEK